MDIERLYILENLAFLASNSKDISTTFYFSVRSINVLPRQPVYPLGYQDQVSSYTRFQVDSCQP